MLDNNKETSNFRFLLNSNVTIGNGQVRRLSSIIENYGYKFPSIINKNNIYGTQFHPEKSHRYGKEIISNFLNLI